MKVGLVNLIFLGVWGLLSGCSELHQSEPQVVAPSPRVSPPAFIPDEPLPPLAPVIQGFFVFGQAGYYGNPQGEYCQLISFPQWRKVGGPEDVSTVPSLGRLPSAMTFKGVCAYRGFFSSNGVGYYANEAGQYCYFKSYDQWVLKGGPTDPALIENFADIPPIMANGGMCSPVIPSGFFRYGDGGYYANALGEYCRFISFAQWSKSGGPDDVTSTPVLTTFPEGMKDQGVCFYRGFFASNGVGFYGNDQGHYCRFESYDQWISKGGPFDPPAIEEFAKIASSMIDDGVCQ